MKKIIIALSLLLSVFFIKSQTVTDILTEQDGTNIIIKYKISESNDKQLFHISISCLVNEKERIKLTAITGDVGDNIKGGKSEYEAVWNVLEDVDELNSAEFFIKSELKEDGSKIRIDPALSNNKWFIAYNSGIGYTQFGFKAGYLNNWGAYAAFRFSPFGYYYFEPYLSDEFGNYLQDENNDYIAYEGELSSYYSEDYAFLYSLSGGISKRLVNNKIKLHVFIGAGYGYWGYYDNNNNDIYYDFTLDQYFVENEYGSDNAGFEMEIGLIGSYNHFMFSAGYANKFGWYGNSGDLTLCIGYTF